MIKDELNIDRIASANKPIREKHLLYTKSVYAPDSNSKVTEYAVHLPFNKELIISKFIDNREKHIKPYVRKWMYIL